MSETTAERKSALTSRKVIKVVGAVAGLLTASGALAGYAPTDEGGSKPVPSSISTREGTPSASPEKTAETLRRLGMKFQEQGQRVASDILGLIADQKNGAEPYEDEEGYFFENKSVLIGPDGNFGTSDDGLPSSTPELLAFYDPKTEEVILRAVAMQGVESESGADDRFNSLTVVISVGPNSQLSAMAAQGKTPTIDNFLDSVASQQSLVEAFTGSTEAGYDGSKRYGTSYGVHGTYDGDGLVKDLSYGVNKGLLGPEIYENTGFTKQYTQERATKMDGRIAQTEKALGIANSQ